MKQTALCKHCRQSFEYLRQGKGVRTVCAPCQERNAHKWRKPPTARGWTTPALRKLAQHPAMPELVRRYRAWVAAGQPRPTLADVGDNLMKLQAKVMVWYERAGRLRALRAEAAAREMEAEIDRCQNFIGEVLGKLRGESRK